MDGLSVLIGILTGVFLIVLFGTNIWNNRSFIEEPFADVASSDLLNHIHSVLDPLALYTSPDGTSIPDGKDLCSVFAVVTAYLLPAGEGQSGRIHSRHAGYAEQKQLR